MFESMLTLNSQESSTHYFTRIVKHVPASELKRILASSDTVVSEIELAPKTAWPTRRLSGFKFEACDFRSLLVGGMFGGPTFEDVTWSDVNFDGLNARGATFRGCHFTNVTIGDRLMADLKSCTFEKCDFVGLVLKNTFFVNCAFVECRLLCKDAQRVNFNNCTISGSEFSGQWSKVNFVDCDIATTDFHAAAFSDSAFYPKRLRDVVFPSDMVGLTLVEKK